MDGPVAASLGVSRSRLRLLVGERRIGLDPGAELGTLQLWSGLPSTSCRRRSGDPERSDRLLPGVMAAPPPDGDLADVVRRAAGGDVAAWGTLVTRFQDAAVGMAVARGGWDGAEDVAQEAFTLAFRHLGGLDEPQAFPAWFATLVRTAAGRRLRRARLATVPIDGVEVADPAANDPAASLEADVDRDRVRLAVEALPPGERAVVALHHLGGLSYRDVAAFLAITESAAKKRAWQARNRMKEHLPMVTDAFATTCPSRSDAFCDRRRRSRLSAMTALRISGGSELTG